MRIPSVDYLRSLAISSIIISHTNPFGGAFKNAISIDSSFYIYGIIELILIRASSYAIPLFFIMAGYFYGIKTRSGAAPTGTLGKYLKRLAIIWFFWGIIYLLLPAPGGIFQHDYFEHICRKFSSRHPLNLLLIGGSSHLWFIPALIMALCIIAFLSKKSKGKIIIFFAVLLYCFRLTRTSYLPVPLVAQIDGFLRMNTYVLDFQERVGVHMDYFIAILFVYVGWRLSEKEYEFNPLTSLRMVLIGTAISVLELFILWKQFGVLPTDPDYLIGTVPLAVGIVMYAFSKPDIGKDSFLSRHGRDTLGIYASHYLFVIYLGPIVQYIEHPFSDLIYPLSVYISSLLLVTFFAKSNWLKQFVR